MALSLNAWGVGSYKVWLLCGILTALATILGDAFVFMGPLRRGSSGTLQRTPRESTPNQSTSRIKSLSKSLSNSFLPKFFKKNKLVEAAQKDSIEDFRLMDEADGVLAKCRGTRKEYFELSVFRGHLICRPAGQRKTTEEDTFEVTQSTLVRRYETVVVYDRPGEGVSALLLDDVNVRKMMGGSFEQAFNVAELPDTHYTIFKAMAGEDELKIQRREHEDFITRVLLQAFPPGSLNPQDFATCYTLEKMEMVQGIKLKLNRDNAPDSSAAFCEVILFAKPNRKNRSLKILSDDFKMKSTGEGIEATPPTGQPLTGQSLTGQPPTGQPLAGQPPTGQPLTGQPPTGQPLTGQPLAGQPLAEKPLPFLLLSATLNEAKIAGKMYRKQKAQSWVIEKGGRLPSQSSPSTSKKTRRKDLHRAMSEIDVRARKNDLHRAMSEIDVRARKNDLHRAMSNIDLRAKNSGEQRGNQADRLSLRRDTASSATSLPPARPAVGG